MDDLILYDRRIMFRALRRCMTCADTAIAR